MGKNLPVPGGSQALGAVFSITTHSKEKPQLAPLLPGSKMTLSSGKLKRLTTSLAIGS